MQHDTDNTAPALTGIDHIHVYVPDREAAADWFARTLGFRVSEALRAWATPGGPLTIEDRDGRVHLALFARADFTPSSAPAFGSSADSFLQWKTRLEAAGILQRCTDHHLAWSLYFADPYGNSYEITTYEHEAVRRVLGADAG